MGQKETIVNLLNTYGTMTQRALAEAIYGDKNHGPNIYAALMGLVNSGAVLRTGSNPSYYSLSGVDIIIPEKPVQTKRDTEMLLAMLLLMKQWRRQKHWSRVLIIMVQRMS